MDESIKRKVEILKASDLFINYSDSNKLSEKQKILLALTGQKPVAELHTSKRIIVGNSNQAIPEDHEKIANLMSQLDLNYLINDDDHFTNVTVSLDEKLFGRYLAGLGSSEGVDKLCGHPDSAIRASYDRVMLMSIDDQEKVEADAGLPYFFPSFRFSKVNYEKELEVLKSWHQTCRLYDLV